MPPTRRGRTAGGRPQSGCRPATPTLRARQSRWPPASAGGRAQGGLAPTPPYVIYCRLSRFQRMIEDGPYVAVDAGAAFTKAYVLDEVDGERRLVAVGRVPALGDDGQPAAEAARERAVQQARVTAGADATPSALQPRVVQRSVVPR